MNPSSELTSSVSIFSWFGFVQKIFLKAFFVSAYSFLLFNHHWSLCRR
jgi:hypothetical protein